MWNEWLSFHFASRRQAPASRDAGGHGRTEHLPRTGAAARLRRRPSGDRRLRARRGRFPGARVVREPSSPPSKSLAPLRRARDAVEHLPPADRRELVRSTRSGSGTQGVEEIPSPWLSGALDEFFDGKLAPLLETNRGCPFTVHLLRAGRALVHQGPQLHARTGCARRSTTSARCIKAALPVDGLPAHRRLELRHVRARHRDLQLHRPRRRRSTAGRRTSTPPPARTAPSG